MIAGEAKWRKTLTPGAVATLLHGPKVRNEATGELEHDGKGIWRELNRDTYARTNDPFALIGREQVGVDVTSVIRASPTSFRVAWVERRYRDGSLAETSRWTAILTTVVQPPRTPDALRKNPLGIFVNAINWSKELGS